METLQQRLGLSLAELLGLLRRKSYQFPFMFNGIKLLDLRPAGSNDSAALIVRTLGSPGRCADHEEYLITGLWRLHTSL